jgi:membrane-bound lytic murein transglycosylase B
LSHRASLRTLSSDISRSVTAGLLGAALLLAPASALSAPPASQPSYAERKEVQAFINEVAGKDGANREKLQALFAGAYRQQAIIDSISRPAEHTITWGAYRKIFITQKRIKGGVDFYNTHREVLKRASRQYGLAPEIMVAIIGVETFYGERKGNYRVIDALSTLAFDYPPRANFFRQQLREFLLLEREAGIPLATATGSYAGAMGYPQFISSSYRDFAVDFDSDNRIDLINNPVDAIGSVGNYFHQHKWAEGQPVAFRASFTGTPEQEKALESQVNQSLSPNTTLGAAKAAGLSIKRSLPDDTPVMIMKLEGSKGTQYWLGLNNFYVITRYNHSSLYAMAVFQLSNKVKEKLR